MGCLSTDSRWDSSSKSVADLANWISTLESRLLWHTSVYRIPTYIYIWCIYLYIIIYIHISHSCYCLRTIRAMTMRTNWSRIKKHDSKDLEVHATPVGSGPFWFCDYCTETETKPCWGGFPLNHCTWQSQRCTESHNLRRKTNFGSKLKGHGAADFDHFGNVLDLFLGRQHFWPIPNLSTAVPSAEAALLDPQAAPHLLLSRGAWAGDGCRFWVWTCWQNPKSSQIQRH